MEDSAPLASGTQRPSRRPGWLASPGEVGLGLLSLILAWLWYDSRGQMSDLREEVVRRVRDSEADSRDARFGARQAQEAMRETQAKLAQLELKLAESQNHQGALEFQQKSTRLNSSHQISSYAVFWLKKNSANRSNGKR